MRWEPAVPGSSRRQLPSAVLLFAALASPLAQPQRAIIVGNLVSALIGVAVASHWGIPAWRPAWPCLCPSLPCLACAACIHPVVQWHSVPSWAMDNQQAGGMDLPIWPVTINSVLLLLAALLFNNFTGRRYPHQPVALGNPPHPRSASSGAFGPDRGRSGSRH